MAIIQRSSDKFSSHTIRKVPLGAAHPRRLHRRRHTQLVCGVSRSNAVVCLVLVTSIGWIVGILGFYFCYSRSTTFHTGFGVPVSPLKSLTREPESANVKRSTKYNATHAKYESPSLIITCKRPNYLSKTLENVLGAISNQCGFGCPVIVSEDGQHKGIEEVVLSFKKKFEAKEIPLVHIRHQRREGLKGNPYEALAKHYGWALSQVFDGGVFPLQAQSTQKQFLPKRVVILEEDIKVAPDFFSYMEATSFLLDEDPTLYAVSAFNDNGHLGNGDPKRVLRSDFFPGLGWMMNRDLWKNELKWKWPNGYWDDWLREGEQRRDRQVLRPEASRTYHFGTKGGASANQFGSILERNKLNSQVVQWDMEDLSYLENTLYEEQYTGHVMNCQLVHSIEEAKHASQDVRMEYEGFSQFSRLAAQLGIMEDEKAIVPRTAYRGIVEARQDSSILFLTPKRGFSGYKKKESN